MEALQQNIFCLEYMVTGLHQQQKFADCQICNFKPTPNLKEEEKEEVKEESELFRQNEKNCPDDNNFQDDYEALQEAMEKEEGQEEEEEIQSSQNDKDETVNEQQMYLKSSINDLKQALSNSFNDQKAVEIILDNTMGQVPLLNRMNECRLTHAVRCLSVAMESLKESQLFRISTTDGHTFNEAFENANTIQLQKVDEYLLNLSLHFKKEAVITTLVNSIQKHPEATAICVLTDLNPRDSTHLLDIVQKALSSSETHPQIHIFSFHLLGVDSLEQKTDSFKFFEQIASASNGSFTGTISLPQKVITVKF